VLIWIQYWASKSRPSGISQQYQLDFLKGASIKGVRTKSRKVRTSASKDPPCPQNVLDKAPADGGHLL